MTDDCLLAFASSNLSDLARRVDQSGKSFIRGQRRAVSINGETREAFLIGTHVCYQGGGKGPGGKPRFRGVDSPSRLSFALSALERYLLKATKNKRGSNRRACLMSAEFLLSEPRLPLRSVLSVGKRGRHPRPVLAVAIRTMGASSGPGPKRERPPIRRIGSTNPGGTYPKDKPARESVKTGQNDMQ